jgi:hypothetical protein
MHAFELDVRTPVDCSKGLIGSEVEKHRLCFPLNMLQGRESGDKTDGDRCRQSDHSVVDGMIELLSLSTLMVVLTVIVHLTGLMGLLWILRFRAEALHEHRSWTRQGAAIIFVVLGLMLMHTTEVWLYAAAYLLVGAQHDLETAIYFSTSSFTTLGYGDVVLDRRWRLLGAIEGANGLLLFGWSTAFLVSITSRVRMLEHDWLERPRA